MVMLRPPGKPYKIAKHVLQKEGVKIRKPKSDGKKIFNPAPIILQH